MYLLFDLEGIEKRLFPFQVTPPRTWLCPANPDGRSNICCWLDRTFSANFFYYSMRRCLHSYSVVIGQVKAVLVLMFWILHFQPTLLLIQIEWIDCSCSALVESLSSPVTFSVVDLLIVRQESSSSYCLIEILFISFTSDIFILYCIPIVAWSTT